MSTAKYLTDSDLPFCKGCGHLLVARNTEKALLKLGFDPLDVVLVTDIGCHGIIDNLFLPTQCMDCMEGPLHWLVVYLWECANLGKK